MGITRILPRKNTIVEYNCSGKIVRKISNKGNICDSFETSRSYYNASYTFSYSVEQPSLQYFYSPIINIKRMRRYAFRIIGL